MRIYPLFFLMFAAVPAVADDWPMGGRASDRNPVNPEKNPPVDWQIPNHKTSQTRNIRWSIPVGSHAHGGPVVANGLVWVGTNNEPPRDPAVTGDRAVLACFRASDGKFLYQYTSPRLEDNKLIADWPMGGLSGSPVVEGDKLWFITNRRVVVCLDTDPLSRGQGLAKELWTYDLMKEQGVYPNSPMIASHNNTGSPALYRDLLFVPTGNGVDVDHPGATKVRAPEAPSLVCFQKDTGKVVWKDNSPGKEAYGGHHAAPLVFEMDGKAQVIHAQGDGWVRSFDTRTGKLIWKFDINRKGAKWDWLTKDGTAKQVVVATPVYAEGQVYFAAGREHEFSGGLGQLCCVDPTKNGDISPELDDGKGNGKPNPNSGLFWNFIAAPNSGLVCMQQTQSSVAVHDGLVIAVDNVCNVHCFDAKTGKRHWTHHINSQQFGDPLIVDDKVYIANEESNVIILALSKTLRVLAKHEMDDNPIVASPVFANGTLYIQSRRTLYAIGKTP